MKVHSDFYHHRSSLECRFKRLPAMPAHLHPPIHSIIYTHPSQERKTPRSSCHADFVSEKKTVKVWERRKKIKYIISASLCVGYTYIQDKTSPIIIRCRRRNHRSIPPFSPSTPPPSQSPSPSCSSTAQTPRRKSTSTPSPPTRRTSASARNCTPPARHL